MLVIDGPTNSLVNAPGMFAAPTNPSTLTRPSPPSPEVSGVRAPVTPPIFPTPPVADNPVAVRVTFLDCRMIPPPEPAPPAPPPKLFAAVQPLAAVIHPAPPLPPSADTT